MINKEFFFYVKAPPFDIEADTTPMESEIQCNFIYGASATVQTVYVQETIKMAF